MQFGCTPSSYDLRDYRLKSCGGSLALPDTYFCPVSVKVKNQKNVYSCVAHAISSILEYHTGAQVSLSTNFIYGIQKELFNREDRGMFLRDACKIVTEYGDMLVEDCPGNSEVPACHTIASKAFADKAKLERASNYRTLKYFTCSCSSKKQIKQAIYEYGPVLASLKWYDNYTAGKDGVLKGDQTGPYEYHAFMVYGYTPDGFWCQNSWGKSWGKNGTFFVPNKIVFNEVRGLADWDGGGEPNDIYNPNTNMFIRIFYKVINAIINFFKKLFKK